MVGRVYTWRTGSCSVGYWRVVCRWASIPGVKVVHNVLVERVVPIDLALVWRGEILPLPRIWHATTERTVRPWYPAPRRVADAG